MIRLTDRLIGNLLMKISVPRVDGYVNKILRNGYLKPYRNITA